MTWQFTEVWAYEHDSHVGFRPWLSLLRYVNRYGRKNSSSNFVFVCLSLALIAAGVVAPSESLIQSMAMIWSLIFIAAFGHSMIWFKIEIQFLADLVHIDALF